MLQGDTVLLHFSSHGCGLGCGYPRSAAAHALAIANAHQAESGCWADVAAGCSVSPLLSSAMHCTLSILPQNYCHLLDPTRDLCERGKAAHGALQRRRLYVEMPSAS